MAVKWFMAFFGPHCDEGPYLECPYDELAYRMTHWTASDSMSLPARLLLCEGYRRAAVDVGGMVRMPFDRAHEIAMALACGEMA